MRSFSDDCCVQITGTITTVDFQIDNIYLSHIPRNNDIKDRVMNTVQDKPNAFATLEYRKWELHAFPSLKKGSSKEVWTIKSCIDEGSPLFVIVTFQAARQNMLTKYIIC